MKVFQEVQDKISKFENGEIFSYSDFNISNEKFLALSKSLSLLYKRGILRKISKGLYYKPEQSIFGELSPTETDILENFLKKSKKNIGYISGTNIYRNMGLTTQLSREFVIMNDTRQGMTEIQNIVIKFVKSPVLEPITNIKILQFLDAITDIKKIPACTPTEAIPIFISKIKKMSNEERQELVKFAKYYKPQTRALVGAFIELVGEKNLSLILKKTLNQLTFFKIYISKDVLINKNNWNIQ